MVDVHQLHRLADRDLARVGLHLAGDHAEERGLTGAVRADDADDRALGDHQVEVLVEELVAEGFGDALHLDDLITKTLAGWDLNLRLGALETCRLVDERLVVRKARLALGLTCLGRLTHPLKLLRNLLLTRSFALLLLLKPLLFLLQPLRVISLVRVGVSAIELEDPLGHVVQEIAVVGDRDDRARVVLQVRLKPSD